MGETGRDTGEARAPIGPQPQARLMSIMESLKKIFDPETGANVLEPGLVRDRRAEGGRVRFTLGPASSVCPVAFNLGARVREAISSVPGVAEPAVRVANHKRAEEIERLLNESSAGEGAE